MKRTGRAPEDLPTIQQLEAERNRLRSKNRYNRTLRSTVAILVVVAALAVLVATLWMPVLRIYGTSMFPTLADGQVVMDGKPGDIFSRVEELRARELDVPETVSILYELRKAGMDVPLNALDTEDCAQAIAAMLHAG